MLCWIFFNGPVVKLPSVALTELIIQFEFTSTSFPCFVHVTVGESQSRGCSGCAAAGLLRLRHHSVRCSLSRQLTEMRLANLLSQTLPFPLSSSCPTRCGLVSAFLIKLILICNYTALSRFPFEPKLLPIEVTVFSECGSRRADSHCEGGLYLRRLQQDHWAV